MVLLATLPIFQAALRILRATPGYAPVALELAQLADEGRIHLDAALEDRAQAKASLFFYIEVFYNRRRRHSALGYQSPHEYEQSLLN